MVADTRSSSRADAVAGPVLALLTAFLSLQPLSTDLYLPSLPAIAQAFGASRGAVQQTLTVFVLGFALFQLAAGPVADRFGRRPVALAGLVAYAAGSVAGAFADGLTALVAARLLQSLGVCCTVVAARAMVRDLFAPDVGARVMARAFSWMSVVIVAGPPVGGLLQAAFDWHAPFAFMAALGALTLAFALARLPETHTARDAGALRPGPLLRNYAQVAASPVFRAYALAGALSYAGLFAFIAGSAFVMIDGLGMSARGFGLLFAAVVSGYLVGTLAARPLLKRYGLQRAMQPAAWLALAGAGTLTALAVSGVRHPAAVALPMFLYVVAHGVMQPCSQAGAIGPFPRTAGAAAALMGTITLSGTLLQVAGTALGGLLAPAGHDGVVQLALTTLVAAAGMVWLTQGPIARQATQPA